MFVVVGIIVAAIAAIVSFIMCKRRRRRRKEVRRSPHWPREVRIGQTRQSRDLIVT